MKDLTFAVIKTYCCNQERNAPCQINITGVKCGEIIENREFRIKPNPDDFEVTVIGLYLSDLENEKSFVEIFPDIYDVIKKYPILVSASDGYDTGVLHNTILRYGIDCKPIVYVTAKNICRKAMNGYSYSYEYMCERIGVNPKQYDLPNHPAIWAEIIINACRDTDEVDILSFCLSNRIIPGYIGTKDYKRNYIQKNRKKKVFEIDESTFDETNPFYGQKVVFTGTLSIMVRDEAMQHVLDIGGECPKDVSKSTNFLVVGEQHPSQVGPDGLSGKQKKAIKIKEEGGDIEILSEAEFIEMLG